MKLKKIACLAALMVFLASGGNLAHASGADDDDDDGFRISIVVGGCVAAGVFFAVSYSSGFTGFDLANRSALINFGDEGWQAGLPMPHVVEKGAAAGETYLEMLTVRF